MPKVKSSTMPPWLTDQLSSEEVEFARCLLGTATEGEVQALIDGHGRVTLDLSNAVVVLGDASAPGALDDASFRRLLFICDRVAERLEGSDRKRAAFQRLSMQFTREISRVQAGVPEAYERARDVLQMMLQTVRRTTPLEMIQATFYSGLLLLFGYRAEQARKTFRRCILACEKLCAERKEVLGGLSADAHYYLAEADVALRRFAEARKAVEEAIRLYAGLGDRARERAARNLAATSYLREGDWENGLAAHRELLDRDGIEVRDEIVQIHVNMAYCLDMLERPDDAAALLAGLLQHHAESAAIKLGAHRALAQLWETRGDFKKAAFHYEQSLALAQESSALIDVGWAHLGLASTLLKQGSQRLALNHLRRGWRVYRSRKHLGGQAEVLSILGQVRYDAGKYAKAKRLWRKVFLLRRGLRDYHALASACSDLALACAELGGLKEMRYYAAQAESLGGGDPVHHATFLQTMAWALVRLGEWEEAYLYTQRAIAMELQAGQREEELGQAYKLMGSLAWRNRNLSAARRWWSLAAEAFDATDNQLNLCEAILNLGTVLMSSGEYEKARGVFNDARASAKRLGNVSHQVSCLLNLSEVSYRERYFSESLGYSSEALKMLKSSPGQRLREGKALYGIGRAHRALGNLEAARDSLNRALSILRELRRQLEVPAHDSYLLETTISAYDEVRSLLLSQGQEQNAFEVTEMTKPRPVRRGLLSDSRTEAGREALGAWVHKCREDLKARRGHWRIDPEYVFLKDMRDPIPTTEVFGRLGASRALIEFYSDGSGLGAFVLGAGQTSHHRLDGAAGPDFRNLCESFVDSAQQGPEGEFLSKIRRMGRDVYDLLFAPLAEQLKQYQELVIVPDKALWNIPFAAIWDGEKYLVERFQLSLALSATNFADVAGGGPDSLRQGCVAIADPDGGLVHARATARQLEHLVPSSRVYVGNDATCGALLRNFADAREVFLGARLRFDEANPFCSFLEFGDRDEDRLHLFELWGLASKRKVVTTWCCKSGQVGRKKLTGSLASMWLGLMYAGADAVLASLWDVVETPASEKLFITFYRHRLSGCSKSRALALAQREILSTGEFAYPFFWGGHILVGDPN